MGKNVEIRITNFYKDIEETEKQGKPVYYNVNEIRIVNEERGKQLIDAGVAELIAIYSQINATFEDKRKSKKTKKGE